MSTRQHLIEQECMDKLGWDISKVASATDKEMVTALQNFKRPKPVEKIETKPITFQQPVKNIYKPISYNENQEVGRHNIQRLRQQIEKKLKFIQSNDGPDDDIALLRTSIEKDKTSLENMIQSVQRDITTKEELIRKKRNTKELLESFRIDGTLNNDDEKHILLVTGQLQTIQSELDQYKSLL